MYVLCTNVYVGVLKSESINVWSFIKLWKRGINIEHLYKIIYITRALKVLKFYLAQTVQEGLTLFQIR